MKTWTLVALFIGLCYLWSFPTTGRQNLTPAASPADQMEKFAKELITAHLREPSSAQFDRVFLANKGDAVCGHVNAKNGFGGYTGFRPFVVTPTGWSMQGREGFSAMWNKRCVLTTRGGGA